MLVSFRAFWDEVVKFFYRCLNHKKIVVISDSKIISIPISTRVQSVALGFVFIGMLWVSHSTGKYFTYETIISEKDSKIWTTSIKNEGLQQQVKDLHKNLKDLNRYFASIQEFDQVAGKNSSQDQAQDKDTLSTDTDQEVAKKLSDNREARQQQRKVRRILEDIETKIGERISSLESVIGLTGVKLETIAKHDEKLGEMLAERSIEDSSDLPQGGPFVAFAGEQPVLNKDQFSNDIDYLLELERVVHSFPLTAPLDEYYLSSRFGKRKDPIRNRMAMHNGLDLVGHYGEKVKVSAPGTVVFAGRKGAYGRYVEVDHGAGIKTRYGHLKEVLVEKGQTVARGEVVGLQGNTGRSTGSHLHYEIHVDGRPVDPYNFLKAGNHVF